MLLMRNLFSMLDDSKSLVDGVNDLGESLDPSNMSSGIQLLLLFFKLLDFGLCLNNDSLVGLSPMDSLQLFLQRFNLFVEMLHLDDLLDRFSLLDEMFDPQFGGLNPVNQFLNSLMSLWSLFLILLDSNLPL